MIEPSVQRVLLLTLVTACSGSHAAPTRDAGTSAPTDAMRASRDATPPGHDAAAASVPPTGGTTFTLGQPSGTFTPTTTPLHGPGIILMGGGTDVDQAFVWMHDTLAGSSTTRMGNIIVFNCQSPPPAIDNAYTPYIYGLAPFQSVQTIYIGGYPYDGLRGAGLTVPATHTDLEIAAWYVAHADAVFFSGGDQADYVSWNGSPLITALTELYARGGVIGGTSAGDSIEGPYVFDDLTDDREGLAGIASADAIADPFESGISFTHDMLSWSVLPGVLSDPHFVTRGRFGRLAAFLARQYADGIAGSGVVGVGVDESNALLIDKNGHATLVQQPSGTEAATGTGAYILVPSGPAAMCQAGEPLVYDNIAVTRLSVPATDSWDFLHGCGTGMRFMVTVDGSSPSNPYSADPFATVGTPATCP